jgi:hypothetical protein
MHFLVIFRCASLTFVCYEAVAVDLKPLTISHTAKIISCTIIIRAKISSDGGKTSNMRKGVVANQNAPPMNPSIDNHCGTSFDLYNR